MGQKIYETDSYVKEFDARVEALDSEGWYILDRTAFYPGGGGQPNDRGMIRVGSGDLEVVEVKKNSEGEVVHRVSGGVLELGAEIHCLLDWQLRYSYMRYHSAVHVVSGAALKLFGAKITGGQIYPDHARVDLNIEGFDRPKATALEEESNRVVESSYDIKVRFVPREEAIKNPNLVRVDPSHYPDTQIFRVIEIEGYDSQFDGGTHVAKTSEVGRITFSKLENKGKNNKRIELVLPSN